ncbi:hypothetical protein Tco_1380528 [Tanacetum coccineum]
MAKQVELNKKKGKGTGQGENRPVWNNVQRLNHQNKFVPKVVLTKTGIFPVNTARQSLSSQAVTTSTARKVNTARPIDNPQRALKNKGIIDSGLQSWCCQATLVLPGIKLVLPDAKDKGKGVLKESPVKKVKRSDLDAAQIAKDVEVARLVNEEELAVGSFKS